MASALELPLISTSILADVEAAAIGPGVTRDQMTQAAAPPQNDMTGLKNHSRKRGIRGTRFRNREVGCGFVSIVRRTQSPSGLSSGGRGHEDRDADGLDDRADGTGRRRT